jgi:hypothetical protein
MLVSTDLLKKPPNNSVLRTALMLIAGWENLTMTKAYVHGYDPRENIRV